MTRVDPHTNLIVETIAVGKAPRFIAAGAGAVWTLNQGDGSVSRIDPATNKVVATIEVGVPGGGGDIAVGEGSVWVTAFEYPLSRIDPSTNTVVQQFTGKGGDAVRVGLGSVWLSNLEAGNVWRIDPRRVAGDAARIASEQPCPSTIFAADSCGNEFEGLTRPQDPPVTCPVVQERRSREAAVRLRGQLGGEARRRRARLAQAPGPREQGQGRSRTRNTGKNTKDTKGTIGRKEGTRRHRRRRAQKRPPRVSAGGLNLEISLDPQILRS